MNLRKELQVVRTIHPVGQGAFYSETLHRPGINDDKHIVYDCGVLPYSSRLEEEIKNFLPDGSTIDIMFISHFHADHVNGLKLLSRKYKIKNVVLPQIDGYDWLYVIENYLTTGIADVNIIPDIRGAVGDAKIIQVAPRDEYIDKNSTLFPLQQLPADIKKSVLIELKGKRASLRQLERLTGISKSMIYRM